MLIKLDTEDNLKIGLKKAADSILSGGVVAIPTESFYGLAVNAANTRAIKRLLDVKKRSGDQPILILIPSVEQLDQYVILIPDIARLLMNEFWPGGLTLIFEAKPNLPRELTAGTGKIGVRLSSHPVATALAQAVGSPITVHQLPPQAPIFLANRPAPVPKRSFNTWVKAWISYLTGERLRGARDPQSWT
jgi:L-threonylcarbamoyladenylate synthase